MHRAGFSGYQVLSLLFYSHSDLVATAKVSFTLPLSSLLSWFSFPVISRRIRLSCRRISSVIFVVIAVVVIKLSSIFLGRTFCSCYNEVKNLRRWGGVKKLPITDSIIRRRWGCRREPKNAGIYCAGMCVAQRSTQLLFMARVCIARCSSKCAMVFHDEPL